MPGDTYTVDLGTGFIALCSPKVWACEVFSSDAWVVLDLLELIELACQTATERGHPPDDVIDNMLSVPAEAFGWADAS
jgi:hypothetical protein